MRLSDLPSNFKTYICEHVFRAEREVKLIIFEQDNSLQMLCGERHSYGPGSVRLVGVGHLLDRQRNLRELYLPQGFEASLTESGQWHVQPFKEDDD